MRPLLAEPAALDRLALGRLLGGSPPGVAKLKFSGPRALPRPLAHFSSAMPAARGEERPCSCRCASRWRIWRRGYNQAA